MGLVAWLIAGVVAGFLAGLLVPGDDGLGAIGQIILGVVGAIVAGFVASALFGVNDPITAPIDLRSLLFATGGAIVTVIGVGLLTESERAEA